MSVPVKDRKPNIMEYVKKGQELYMLTVNTFLKIQSTYPELVSELKELSNHYFIEAYMADNIYIDKYVTKEVFKMRERHLTDALAYINGYRAELNLLYSIIRKGDSRLGNKEETEKKFRRVGTIAKDATKLILGIKESDKKRWEEWHPNTKQQNRNKDKADSRGSITDDGGFMEDDVVQVAKTLKILYNYKQGQEDNKE